MKLVCFLGLTGGGLVCDLLNHKKSEIHHTNGNVLSKEHNVFKNLTPYLDKGPFNETMWEKQVRIARVHYFNSDNLYFGTHTHPSNIPDKFIKEFKEIVVITTISKKCKWYKYLRFKNLYHHMMIDPETVLLDYPCINNYTEIKFSDIVDGEFVRQYNLDVEHFENWKSHNNYLYTQPLIEDLEKFNLLFDTRKDLYGTKRTSITNETQ
jgi:hypothetical protein